MIRSWSRVHNTATRYWLVRVVITSLVYPQAVLIMQAFNNMLESKMLIFYSTLLVSIKLYLSHTVTFAKLLEIKLEIFQYLHTNMEDLT